jgi:hypothetical protein
MTTEPTPTPKQQNSPAAPDENISSPERDGFFRRVQRVLKPAPTEAEEIVIMPGEEGDGASERD